MSFSGDEGGFISPNDAGELTSNYRTANEGAVQGHFFGKSKIEDLLAQTGCKGLRIYYGITTASGEDALVVVGVDANENDILDSSNPLVLDQSVLCPPTCGDSNVLNS